MHEPAKSTGKGKAQLDRHLVFPLLEFLQERQFYSESEILEAKIRLLNGTNMVDYAMDIHKSLYDTDDVLEDMVKRRAEVVSRLRSLEEAAAPLVAFLQNPLVAPFSERNVSALWGKLAAEILMQNWDVALEELNCLKEIIDSKNFSSPLNQLQNRIWLMHWAMFIFFNHENGRNGIIDPFFQDRYLNAMQTNAHHLIRSTIATRIP
ncbi:Eukaryotic translation initiation factor 3 subunit E [Zea mays]|uniref:Eukaryotic translation initiation factor 3 subunit E n=1 Tax=Zea mays TaxID=4577 RepID=A0A1D6MT70_MAIZE|nr:Eukaryotic translation initiation factor 3 subunit E [Zea mays]